MTLFLSERTRRQLKSFHSVFRKRDIAIQPGN
jgi:hypothetical protein